MRLGLILISPLCAALLGAAESDVQTGIVYREAGGERLTLDYYPAAGAGPHPIAVLAHGGGFQAGESKSSGPAYLARFLAPAGYATFSINYRLAPKHGFPAAIDDMERAIRFIRHNARRWHADPKRLALIGLASGGYLANMVGVTGRKGERKAHDAVDRESAKPQAVVSFFAYSDLRAMKPTGGLHTFLKPLLEKNPEGALSEASPVMHITPGAPPFLLVHGDQDKVVPLVQSTHWQNALQAAGVRCDLIIIHRGGHGIARWHALPEVRDWEREMVDWLNSILRHSGSASAGIRGRQPGGAARAKPLAGTRD